MKSLRHLVGWLSFLSLLLRYREIFAQESKNVKPNSIDGQDRKNRTEGRAALFSQSRILPFLDPLLNPLNILQQPIPVGPVLPQLHHGFKGSRNCAKNGLFCLYDDAYPRDKMNLIVDRYYNEVRDMYSSLHRIPVNDLLHHDNITHRYREGGHFVCESQVQYIRPGWARNIRGEWLAIINTDKFPQVVRVEECKYATRRCEYLPPCYKSTCVQRYSSEKLLCADPLRPGGKPIVDVFEIPTACSCFVENFVYY